MEEEKPRSIPATSDRKSSKNETTEKKSSRLSCDKQGPKTEKSSNPSSSPVKQNRPPPPNHKPPTLNKSPGNVSGDKLASANKCNNVRQKSFAKTTDEKKPTSSFSQSATATTAQTPLPTSNKQNIKATSETPQNLRQQSSGKKQSAPGLNSNKDGSQQISRQQFGSAGQKSGELEPKNKEKQRQQLLSPQNADGRSPKFQRQRSFVTRENNQIRQGPLTSANSPPRNQGSHLANNAFSGSHSPRFKRTRTISCIETTGVQNRWRGRSSNSISESEKESLHEEKKEIPGIHPKKTAGLSSQEKGLIFDAMQAPGVVMKSKARILIDVSDVLFKTVLTHRVAPSDATLIAFKILEIDASHTFVESLINSSQDYYKKMTSTEESQESSTDTTNPLVIFLCELYQVLKQRSFDTTSNLDALPHLTILSLLMDYCSRFLIDFIKRHNTSLSDIKIELFAKYSL